MMTVSSPTSPREMAAELRAKAERAAPADRSYLLWLASEWDRTAERDAGRATWGRSEAAA